MSRVKLGAAAALEPMTAMMQIVFLSILRWLPRFVEVYRVSALWALPIAASAHCSETSSV